ncbi:flagellar hook protein FlgE [Sodalis-like endosymbiont of Proechinophthirus fluctus]|uniref:flagellar hook protein FlgE n=1 Tax=Sodalis-like endosymbiont of Proechinophthirus fluctus TaxID=1462730 RepID=UPI0007A7DD1D|nr:flagellar hook protein FlgE [Sodalis-like endosymbiont of Proechinophthirus fluctus]KYP97220.1 flagellar hook protein FlgE [Sodalis-like endosymbiont of Proechinophthirus fluctus]
MGFAQGVSGLNAAAQALDVISNNIANAQTVGFKSSSASFSDMFSGSMIGLGVQLAGVQQSFNNGMMIAGTGNINMAIMGSGFFRLADNGGKIYYSRNGEFALNKYGEIVNKQGKHLTGYKATGTPPMISGGTPLENITVPDTPMPGAVSTEGSLGDNLPSNAEPPEVGEFDIKEPKSYNYSTQFTAYDSLGNPHNIKIFYIKGKENGQWTVKCYDETAPTLIDLNNPDKNPKIFSKDITFDAYGNLYKDNTPKLPIESAKLNGANELNFDITLFGLTQQGTEWIQSLPQTNGHAVGKFNGYSIGDNGEIITRYSNQLTQLIAQVVMADFTNTGGLQPTGDNCWIETGASGSPLIGTSGTGSFGVIRGKMLEASNVDMSNELVKMMTQQRNYQSNAQTIKTQDQLLQTLVSMR